MPNTFARNFFNDSFPTDSYRLALPILRFCSCRPSFYRNHLSNRVSYSLSPRNFLPKFLNEHPSVLETSQSVAKVLNLSNVTLKLSFQETLQIASVAQANGTRFSQSRRFKLRLFRTLSSRACFVGLRKFSLHVNEAGRCSCRLLHGRRVAEAGSRRDRGSNSASMTGSLSSLFSHFLSLSCLADRTLALLPFILLFSLLSSQIT